MKLKPIHAITPAGILLAGLFAHSSTRSASHVAKPFPALESRTVSEPLAWTPAPIFSPVSASAHAAPPAAWLAQAPARNQAAADRPKAKKTLDLEITPKPAASFEVDRRVPAPVSAKTTQSKTMTPRFETQRFPMVPVAPVPLPAAPTIETLVATKTILPVRPTPAVGIAATGVTMSGTEIRGLATPMYVAADNAGAVTTFDTNGFLGAAAQYALPNIGLNARVANIEGGLPRLTHEVFTGAPITTFFGAGAATTGVTRDHPTATLHAIGGRGAGNQQRGIAYGISNTSGNTGRLYAGSFVTGFNPDGSYIYTYNGMYTAYRDAILTGVGGVSTELAHVVNSSWGIPGDPGSGVNGDASRFADALLSTSNDGVGVARRGVTMVVSAGNLGPAANTITSPANGHNTFVVGALGGFNTGHMPYSLAATYSGRGPQDLSVPTNSAGSSYTTLAGVRNRIDIAAPGSNAVLANNVANSGTTAYTVYDGSSFASATVAGGAALLVNRANTIYSGNFADATDGRVVKAVLMNSADKTANWNNGAATGLDVATGAGRLNLESARLQYETGFGTGGFTAMAAPNTTVNQTGWTRATSGGSGTFQTFEINGTIPAFAEISATLNWFSNRSLTNPTTGTTLEGGYHNLDLYLDQSIIVFSQVLSSNSTYNLSEHVSGLYNAGGGTPILRWRVAQTGPIWQFDSATATYGLAWSIRPSTVAFTGTTTATASASTPNLLVAPYNGDTATYTISGSAVTIRATRNAYVGGFQSYDPGINGNIVHGGAATLNVNSGATLQVSDTMLIFGNDTLNINGSTVQGGVLNLYATGATVNSTGTSTLGFSTIHVNDASSILAGSGTLTLPAYLNDAGVNIAALNMSVLTLGGAGNIVVNSSLGGTTNWQLTKTGAGTLTLGAAHSTSSIYTPAINITAGTVLVNAASALPTNTALAVNGGTLQFGAANSLPANGSITSNTGGIVNLNGFGNTSPNALATLTINGGAVNQPSGSASVYLNKLVSNGGALNLTGSTASIFRFVNAGADITVGGTAGSTWTGAGTGRIQNDTANPLTITVNGTGDPSFIDLDLGIRLSNLGTNANFIKAGGGKMRLTNTGNTANFIVSGGYLRVDDMAALGTGTVTLMPGAFLQYNGPTATSSKALALSGGYGSIYLPLSGVNLTLTGAISESGTNELSLFGLASSSGSTLTLANAANAYSGATYVDGGLTLAIPMIANGGVASPIGTSSSAPGNITLGRFGVRGTLMLTGTAANYSTDRGLTVGSAFPAGGAIGVANAATTLTVTGLIQGAGSLVKTGAGTLVIGGAAPNTFTGNAFVEAGTLRMANVNALPANSSVTVYAGGEFSTGAVSNFPGPALGFIYLDGGTFRIPAPGADFVTIGFAMYGGNVDLSAANGNNIYLGGIFSYARPTTSTVVGAASSFRNATSGPLQLYVEAGTTSTGIDLDIAAGFQPYSNMSFYKSGTGTLRLTNTTLNQGNFAINSGRIRVDDVSTNTYGALGTGAWTIDGGTLAFGGTSQIMYKNFTLGGTTAGGSVEVLGANTILNAYSVFSGGTLTKTGAGTLVLLSPQSYGATVVQNGILHFYGDNYLGSGSVIVNPFGQLRVGGNATTAREYTLNGGTLSVTTGATLTFNNATVAGGFLSGPGTFATQAGASSSFAGGSLTPSSNFNINGTDSFLNYNFGGQATFAAAAVTSLNNVVNTTSGRMTFANGATVNASSFTNNGLMTFSGGTVPATTTRFNNVGGTDMYLGGGSRTFLGYNGSTSPVKLDLGGYNLVIAGGFLQNNGGNFASGGGVRNGTVIVDFGGRAKGAGYYEDILTQNGGVFSPGNSPGTTQTGTARVSPGGILNIDIDAAGPNGTNGVGTAGTAPGWSQQQGTGALRIYSTPGQPFTITLTSQQLGGLNVAAPVSNFNPALPHGWEVIRMLPGANLFNVQTGGTALDPATYVYDPSIVVVNTADFQNALAGGTFSTAFLPNGTGTYSVFVTFAPVPEPAEMMLIGAALIGVGVWRRKRIE